MWLNFVCFFCFCSQAELCLPQPQFTFQPFLELYPLQSLCSRNSWELTSLTGSLHSSTLDKSWSVSSQVSRKKRKVYCTFGLISLGTRNNAHFWVTIETSALKKWPSSARFGIKLSNDNDDWQFLLMGHHAQGNKRPDYHWDCLRRQSNQAGCCFVLPDCHVLLRTQRDTSCWAE